MSHAYKTRTADSLSPTVITGPFFLSPQPLRTLLPGRMGLPSPTALGILRVLINHNVSGGFPPCFWVPGSHHHIPLPQPFLILLSFPLKATTLCFIDLCLVPRTGGPISFTLIKGQNSLSGISPGLNKAPEIPSRKSGCPS